MGPWLSRRGNDADIQYCVGDDMTITRKAILLFFIFISTLAILVNTASATAINITDADATYEANLSSVSVPTSPVPIKTVFVVNADISSDKNLSAVSIPTQPSPLKEIYIINEDAALKKNLSTVCIPTEPLPVKEIFIHNAEEAILTKSLVPKGVSKVFDTRAPANPYPSISGTHNGTIKPKVTIEVSKLYTYPCPGTGGHSEYMKIWNDSADWNVTANWEGYSGDWYNISFGNSFTLEEGGTYNYTIRTGSYPQIHHTDNLSTSAGFITCSEFIDANGKRYDYWIPAIRLWAG